MLEYGNRLGGPQIKTERILRIRLFQGRTGRDHNPPDRREQCFRTDAYGRREITLLPAPGPRDGGHGDRDIAPHRPDEEPGGCHQRICLGTGRHSPFPQFIPVQSPDKRSQAGPAGRDDQTAVRGAGIAHQGREHRTVQGNKDIVLCHR